MLRLALGVPGVSGRTQRVRRPSHPKCEPGIKGGRDGPRRAPQRRPRRGFGGHGICSACVVAVFPANPGIRETRHPAGPGNILGGRGSPALRPRKRPLREICPTKSLIKVYLRRDISTRAAKCAETRHSRQVDPGKVPWTPHEAFPGQGRAYPASNPDYEALHATFDTIDGRFASLRHRQSSEMEMDLPCDRVSRTPATRFGDITRAGILQAQTGTCGHKIENDQEKAFPALLGVAKCANAGIRLRLNRFFEAVDPSFSHMLLQTRHNYTLIAYSVEYVSQDTHPGAQVAILRFVQEGPFAISARFWGR